MFKITLNKRIDNHKGLYHIYVIDSSERKANTLDIRLVSGDSSHNKQYVSLSNYDDGYCVSYIKSSYSACLEFIDKHLDRDKTKGLSIVVIDKNNDTTIINRDVSYYQELVTNNPNNQ